MRRRLRIGLIVVGLLLVAAGAVWQFYDPGSGYRVRGVDVSHHQGPIDWPALAADDTSFAYIKATEGGDWVDSRFEENWEASRDAGVIRGAYHFFTFCRPGIEQAANLIATVPVEPGMLPPAVDLEFGGNCDARPTVADFRAELEAFLDAAEAHYGSRLVAYVPIDFYDAYLAADPPDMVWWVRSLGWEPLGEPQWTFWQYFIGEKDGVAGRVDRNAFAGDLDDLRALTLNG